MKRPLFLRFHALAIDDAGGGVGVVFSLIAAFDGFVWSVPVPFRDGKRHRLYRLYAYDIDTTVVNTNKALLSGAKRFRFALR